MYYVYILKWARYYVGYTNDLTRRIAQHQSWKTYSTSRYGELKLLGYFLFSEKLEAMTMESKIKQSKNIKKWIWSEGFIAVELL